MSIAIGVALAVLVVIVVAWPLVRSQRRGPGRSAGPSETARLRQAREEIYEQIRQLQTDRDGGLISEDEYSAHLRELRVSAAELMRAQERLGGEVTAADRLELEIEAARSASSHTDDAPAESEEKE